MKTTLNQPGYGALWENRQWVTNRAHDGTNNHYWPAERESTLSWWLAYPWWRPATSCCIIRRFEWRSTSSESRADADSDSRIIFLHTNVILLSQARSTTAIMCISSGVDCDRLCPFCKLTRVSLYFHPPVQQPRPCVHSTSDIHQCQRICYLALRWTPICMSIRHRLRVHRKVINVISFGQHWTDTLCETCSIHESAVVSMRPIHWHKFQN